MSCVNVKQTNYNKKGKKLYGKKNVKDHKFKKRENLKWYLKKLKVVRNF